MSSTYFIHIYDWPRFSHHNVVRLPVTLIIDQFTNHFRASTGSDLEQHFSKELSRIKVKQST